jgi:DNA-binding CsgD family transcriptional regulator
MLVDDPPRARTWGERAIALAEQLGDAETLVHALINVGTVLLDTPARAQGLDSLERAIALARSHGFHEHQVRAYTNIACTNIRRRDYAGAEPAVELTLRFSEEHELETWELYILGWRARLELERGRWDSAEHDAEAVLGRYGVLTVVRSQPLVTRALLRARRGQPGADEALEEALRLASSAAEIQRIGPAVAALAETAWIRGDLAPVRDRLAAGYERALRSDDRWSQGQLALWLRRAGGDVEPPAGAAEPFALLLAGDWQGAAAAWERIGNPYEQALALAESDDPEAWRVALVILDGLGAAAAAAAVRRDLRTRGVGRGVPRGPRARTRRHPAGLTAGQVRVLDLLARGLTNPDIARELYLSRRTVDHHVSAILAKLGVTTRAQAIAAAHERRLVAGTQALPSAGSGTPERRVVPET